MKSFVLSLALLLCCAGCKDEGFSVMRTVFHSGRNEQVEQMHHIPHAVCMPVDLAERAAWLDSAQRREVDVSKLPVTAQHSRALAQADLKTRDLEAKNLDLQAQMDQMKAQFAELLAAKGKR